MSVSRAPRASVSVRGALSADELNDLIAQTFIQKIHANKVKLFLKLQAQADALPAANFRKLIALAFKQIENQSLPADTCDKLLSDMSVLPYFDFILSVLQSAARLGTKEAAFQADLNKLSVKNEYLTELVNAYKAKREPINTIVKQQKISLPSITNVRWRVDVTISSTSLSRVFKPVVLLQLTLSDGRVSQFECSVEKFHALRYAVTRALKNTQDLQVHPTIVREIE